MLFFRVGPIAYVKLSYPSRKLTFELIEPNLLGVLGKFLRFFPLVAEHGKKGHVEDQGQRQPLEGDQQRGVAVVAEKKTQARPAQDQPPERQGKAEQARDIRHESSGAGG